MCRKLERPKGLRSFAHWACKGGGGRGVLQTKNESNLHEIVTKIKNMLIWVTERLPRLLMMLHNFIQFVNIHLSTILN